MLSNVLLNAGLHLASQNRGKVMNKAFTALDETNMNRKLRLTLFARHAPGPASTSRTDFRFPCAGNIFGFGLEGAYGIK